MQGSLVVSHILGDIDHKRPITIAITYNLLPALPGPAH